MPKLNISLIRHYEDVAYLDQGTPRYFSVTNGESKLLFFGSRHTYDSTDPMLSQIKALVDAVTPDIIFVEGLQALRRMTASSQRAKWLHDISSLSTSEAVTRFGERGLAVKYALERDILVECPEPELAEELRYVVTQGFSRDGIVGYYVFRMVHQWLQGRGDVDVGRYLAPTIEELKILTGWDDYDWSFRNISSLSETFWGTPLKLDDEQFYLRGISPFTTRTYSQATETNHVCAASGFFRDQAIATEIVSAGACARSLFVLFGSGHSYTLEGALRAAFSS